MFWLDRFAKTKVIKIKKKKKYTTYTHTHSQLTLIFRFCHGCGGWLKFSFYVCRWLLSSATKHFDASFFSPPYARSYIKRNVRNAQRVCLCVWCTETVQSNRYFFFYLFLASSFLLVLCCWSYTTLAPIFQCIILYSRRVFFFRLILIRTLRKNRESTQCLYHNILMKCIHDLHVCIYLSF